ncbi:hypothetical protein BS47DRAFT_1013379 [Hydnum rufescens UP504]|uniref:NAD(P)-binding protein n=1 Tax=Hydnum rufescens UP504 TaxID=1448309 RepID=A0A9P6AWP0_9AGAM|nr:hypothetical protein BS47DRAFT_1013379 [Hydnum rufescens UP504]
MEYLNSLSYTPQYISSVYAEVFPPKPKWSPDDIPDLSEKVFLITGKAVAEDLLAHDAKVYIAGRSVERVTEAIEELKKITGKGDDRVKFLKLDLADLKSVKSAVDEFLSKESRLDVLINNAGMVRVPGTGIDQITPSGLNVEFAVNVLGHFYLTQLLLPILISTAKSSPDGKVRVVNLTSAAHFGSKIGKNGPIDYRTLEGPQSFLYFAYSQSKSGNILFSNELARRYGDQGIVSIAVHPGAIDTRPFAKVRPSCRPCSTQLLCVFMEYSLMRKRPTLSSPLVFIIAFHNPESRLIWEDRDVLCCHCAGSNRA